MTRTWNLEPTARTAPAWTATAALGILAGVALNGVGDPLPGSEPVTIEDGVDAVGMLALGLLGAVLLRRGVAARLGAWLVLLAWLTGLSWFLDGLGGALASGGDPDVVAQIAKLIGDAAFIGTFAILVAAPLLLFPTGELPSPRWRWVVRAILAGIGISVLSVLLRPGAVDEDVAAWGDNPLGVQALEGVLDATTAAGLVLLLVGLAGSLAAFVVRCVRYRGGRRRQMAWFTLGVAPMVLGLVIDPGSSVGVEVTSAVVIFGGLLVGMGWPLLGPPSRQASPAPASVSRIA